MKMISSNNYIYFAILATFLWSCIVLLSIVIKDYGVTHDLLLYYLSLFSIVSMGIMCLIDKKDIKEKLTKNFNINHFIGLIFLASISFLLYRFIFYYSMQNLNAIVVNSLNYSLVIFSVIISIYLKNSSTNTFDFYTKYILFFGFIGIILLFDVLNSGTYLNIYYISVLVAAFFSALDLNIVVKIKDKFIDNIWFIYFLVNILVFLFMNIYVLIYEVSIQLNLTQTLIILGFSTLFSITNVIFTVSFHKGEAVIVSFLVYLIPIFSTIGLIIFYDYEITISTIFGFLIILSSGILINPNVKKYLSLKIRHYLFLGINRVG